jgi:hypothetical protein
MNMEACCFKKIMIMLYTSKVRLSFDSQFKDCLDGNKERFSSCIYLLYHDDKALQGRLNDRTSDSLVTHMTLFLLGIKR